EAAERIEQRSPQAVGRRMLEREAQRHQDEARDSNELRCQQTLRVRVELATRRADEERNAVQEIDRPVGKYRPSPERYRAFPREHDRRHVGPLRREPVRKAVRQKEERAEEREPGKRAAPWPRFARGSGGTGRHTTRWASETVKMPDSPTRCATLRKPAARTSWSSSCCVRRRMTHAVPRWLVSARAISSSCGCQGCPV